MEDVLNRNIKVMLTKFSSVSFSQVREKVDLTGHLIGFVGN